MSAENGHNPTNVGKVDYQVGELTFGRGNEMPIPDGLEESYANQAISFAEMVDNARTDVGALALAGREAVHNLVSPGPDVDRRNLSLARLGLAALAAGAIGSYPDTSYAAPLDHAPQPGHTYHVAALPTYGPALRDDSQPSVLGGESGGPDPDDERPTETPRPKRNNIYMPSVLKRVVGHIAPATAEPATRTPEPPTPIPTAKPTDLPQPTPSPFPSPSPQPSPSPTPTMSLGFNPMYSEPVLVSPAGGGVVMTTGGNDDVDWLPAMYERGVVAGTGFGLDNNPAGVMLKVEANPNMPSPINGSKNMDPDSDPMLVLAGSVQQVDGHDVDLRTTVLYDADQWKVNALNPCDGDEIDGKAVDTTSALTSTAATVTFLANNGPLGERHYVEIKTDQGVCAEDIAVNSNQPLEGRQYHERHVEVELPPNTKSLIFNKINRLSIRDPEELLSRYPELAYARSYIEAFGGPDVAIANTDFWRNAEAWQLITEGYIKGIAFDPIEEYHANTPRLSQTDLLVSIARQHGLDLYIPSYVNSYHGAPEWISRLGNSYGNTEVDNRVKTASRAAYGILSDRWNAVDFPGLTIGAVANPASPEKPESRRRRTHLDYFPYEAHWVSGPTSHITDILGRVYKSNPQGLVAFEQRGLILGMNPDLMNNGHKVVGEAAAVVPKKETMLVLPIFDYPDTGIPIEDLAARMKIDLGTYADEYGRVLLPIYPNGDFDAGVALSAAAISTRQQNPALRVALPGAWGKLNTTDILRSPLFTSAMRAAVVEKKSK